MFKTIVSVLNALFDEDAGALKLLIVNNGKTLRAVKTADTSRTATAAIAADPHLSVPLEAAKTYKFRALLFVTAGTGGLKVDLSGGDVTVTGVKRMSRSYDDALLASQKNTDITTDFNATMEDTAGIVEIEGVIETNAAGTFKVAWAQQTSDADNTTIEKYSYLEAVEA